MTTELKPVAYQLTAPSLGNVNGIVTIEEFSHYLFSDYAIPLYAIPEDYAVVENSKLLRMLELAKTHLNRLIFVAEKIGSSECDAYIKELSDCELMIIELNKTGDK